MGLNRRELAVFVGYFHETDQASTIGRSLLPDETIGLPPHSSFRRSSENWNIGDLAIAAKIWTHLSFQECCEKMSGKTVGSIAASEGTGWGNSKKHVREIAQVKTWFVLPCDCPKRFNLHCDKVCYNQALERKTPSVPAVTPKTGISRIQRNDLSVDS
jgi:hypothetical protein